MKLAALQFSPVRGDVDGNIGAMRGLLGDMHADLLVIPELASTGYFFTDREALIDLAEEPAGGAFCTWMRSIAAERRMVVVGGFAERDAAGKLYNSALIALPDGTYRVYRKSHLFYKEKWVFEPGDTGFFVTEWEGWRVGTMICYDWRFPESSRALALRGADVIAQPSNLVAAASLWGAAMAMRAVENKVIVVTANRSGGELNGEESLAFTGESRIIGMNGAVLAIAGPADESVIAADADPLATRRKSFNEFNDIFADRRSELYEKG
jgi:predicted amidohydrolase